MSMPMQHLFSWQRPISCRLKNLGKSWTIKAIVFRILGSTFVGMSTPLLKNRLKYDLLCGEAIFFFDPLQPNPAILRNFASGYGSKAEQPVQAP